MAIAGAHMTTLYHVTGHIATQTRLKHPDYRHSTYNYPL